MKRILVALSLGLLLGACDDGSGGPGELTGTLESPGSGVGGAVLEVVGKGITGFSGSGGTQVYWAPSSAEGTYRVILLSQASGELRFRVAVQEKGAKKPQAVVVSVVSGANVPVPATADYRVRFSGK